MSKSTDNLRKAAILVATLDRPLADQVLARLAPEQAEQVRRAVAAVDSLPRAERDAALESFITASSTAPSADVRETGVEIDGSLTALFNGDDTTPRDQLLAADPFRFLENADATRLARLLEREHPQTVAVVLVSLAADRASELLCRLPGDLQLDVLRRMSSLEPGDPQSVEAIAKELQAWAESPQHGEQRHERGLAAVRDILTATVRKGYHEIADRIRKRDTGLAERLGIDSHILSTPAASDQPGCSTEPGCSPQSRPASPRRAASPRPTETPRPRLRFAELAHLGDTAWSQLLRTAEPELVALALAGADPILVERAASQLPFADAVALRESLAKIGPTRLADVQIARDELARLATQLPLAA
jgi:flagellar motor switch protein FliG